ncbi:MULTISPECIES: glutathione S-transferase family protein [Methylobacterium]|uniref:Beta-etherase n=1 Tax=Methylobacterium isbiliense TaxID=315478 RepID=A0ABQ4SB35_9HYPH|nr:MULTISPECIES: glutathione S-transferase family protein [Methylobacterium]MBY0300009.1 glutathione S-transferase family protein [Methylobacterium sp.]MDN3623603.1 glutathione S-transferase family protein [Methylobacterium isbiliense]GJD99733.1 Beta-etherase [Methylobacterium isbiliense]
MTRLLYELAGAEPDRRFSPFCWRIRLALEHKGLPFEGRPWRFTEREAIAFSGSDKVPVLVDGARTIADSAVIAAYLEETYPDAPSLFGGPQAQALARFIGHWADGVLHPALVPLLLTDIHGVVAPQDRDYFRQSREARFGKALEAVCPDPEAQLVAFRRTLSPLRATLRAQPFLGGDGPLYADHIVMGAFLWARSVSARPLLEPDDPVAAWRERMLARLGEGSRGLVAA